MVNFRWLENRGWKPCDVIVFLKAPKYIWISNPIIQSYSHSSKRCPLSCVALTRALACTFPGMILSQNSRIYLSAGWLQYSLRIWNTWKPL